MDVFRLADPMPPDQATIKLLNALAQNPDLIRLGGPSFLATRLKDLLADGFDPGLVARVARAILAATGSSVGDIRSRWAHDASDLIQIALTLQRIKATRSLGLELFESLMDLGAPTKPC